MNIIYLIWIVFYSRFLNQAAINEEEKVDKHRFLVQSKNLEDAEYERLLTLPQFQRIEEVIKLFL